MKEYFLNTNDTQKPVYEVDYERCTWRLVKCLTPCNYSAHETRGKLKDGDFKGVFFKKIKVNLIPAK